MSKCEHQMQNCMCGSPARLLSRKGQRNRHRAFVRSGETRLSFRAWLRSVGGK